MTSRKRLRLAHTSDIHLGMSSDWQKDFSTTAFKSVIDAVPRLEAHILLLAGDIFDHSRVSDDLLEFFTDQVGRLPVPVVALPGNHDCYDSTSVYRRGPFHKLPQNLHIITGLEGESFSFPDMGLTVWGRAMEVHSPSFRPLEGIPPRPNGDWYVALAHGHFHYDYDKDSRSSPIHPEEIAAAQCDYIALGHWERYVDVSQGCVRACYSGAPRSGLDNAPGRLALVVMDPEKGVEVHRPPV